MKIDARKAAVVTGAARGIGKAAAAALARRGVRLVLADVDGEELARARDEVARGAAAGADVFAVSADVSSAAGVELLREEANARLGRVDLLCCVAGVAVAGRLEEMPLAEWERIVGVNLWGVVHCCRAFYPAMAAQGGGHIVNVSSLAAFTPIPACAAYCATKSAVLAFSEALRVEAAVRGVGVTTLCPGIVATGIIGRTAVHAATRRLGPAEVKERLARLFAARGIPPERVAARLVRAVERNEGVVPVGIDARFVDWAGRHGRGPWSALVRGASRVLLTKL
jgi:short-subunit dehydrogenase